MEKKLIREMKQDRARLEAIHKDLMSMKSYDWTVLDALKQQITDIDARIQKLEKRLEHTKQRQKLKLPDNVYMVDFKAKKLVA